MTTAQKQTYADAPTTVVGTADGFDYAYRDVGTGTVPLVLLQHFRGNLDNWDPALIDALASHGRVVAFDNGGVGGTNGTTPNTVEQMAADRKAFIGLLHAAGEEIYTPFEHGDGQSLFREALLIADHTSYHVGEIIILRRLLKDWD